jgi:DNA-binding transcriptional MerR regulator
VPETTYTMTQLQGETGLSYPTIRKYIRECSLPGAIQRGVYASYPRETLDKLRAIVECKEGNRSLRDIRDWLHPYEGSDGDDPLAT